MIHKTHEELELQITELKKQIELFRLNSACQNEDKFRNLIEFAADGIIIGSFDGIIIEANSCFCSMIGKNKEDLIGKQLNILPFTKESQDKEPLRYDLLQKGETVVSEKEIIRSDGKILTVEMRTKMMPDKTYQTIYRDLSEKKVAEQALQASEEKYRIMVQYASDPIFIFNADETYRYVNDCFAKNIGKAATDIIGKTPHDIFPYDEAESRLNLVRKVFKTGESGEIEVKVITSNGVENYFLTVANPIKDKQDNILWVTCISRNITERKEKEQKLRASEEKFRLMIKNSNDVFLLVNENQEVFFASDVIYNLTGYTVEEITGSVAHFIPPDDLVHSIKGWMSAFANKNEIVRVQYRHKHKQNGYVWFESVIQNHIDNPAINAIVVNARDITANKEAELIKKEIDELIIAKEKAELSERITKEFSNELIKTKERAEESDRLKSAFLANMSHEIRTPMNGILGFAQLLKEPELSGKEQNEYLNIIENSGKRMLNIIRDIVDISKIESGMMEISHSETNINDQIKFIYDFFTPEIEKKGLQLLYKTALSPNESIIKTDQEKIYAILTNLVNNAVKHTSTGSIEFGYDKKGKYLEFYVKDTGIGVAEHQKEIIFERFRQGDDLTKQYTEGTGLGLSISKAYVEMLGGKIWLESEFGKGSTFYFTLPYDVETGKKEVNEDSPSVIGAEHYVKNLKILIAEDDQTSLSFLSKVLQQYCREIIKVETGVEAVEACRKNPDIDLVLMDIRMPDLNGYEATRQIRGFNNNVIIIAQTAYAMADDKGKALDAGCDDYISKPVNIEKLNALIHTYFSK